MILSVSCSPLIHWLSSYWTNRSFFKWWWRGKRVWGWVSCQNSPLYISSPSLRYTTLRYSTLHYATLRYATLRYTTLRYSTLHYAMLHYTLEENQPHAPQLVGVMLTVFTSLIPEHKHSQNHGFKGSGGIPRIQLFPHSRHLTYSGAKKYLVSHQLCKFSHLKWWARPVSFIIGTIQLWQTKWEKKIQKITL